MFILGIRSPLPVVGVITRAITVLANAAILIIMLLETKFVLALREDKKLQVPKLHEVMILNGALQFL